MGHTDIGAEYTIIKEFVQRYNFSKRGGDISFVAPAAAQVQLDMEGYADMVVDWKNGVTSNLAGLLMYADGCSGRCVWCLLAVVDGLLPQAQSNTRGV